MSLKPSAGPFASETPELWFHRRATQYVETQILFHLNQCGVFSALAGGGAQTAMELAQRHQLEPRVLATLLDYVFEVDQLLERDAQDRYSLSPFGQQVVRRFSSQVDERLNLFDVRVGGYGPVWANLGRLLTGAAVYGADFRRDGRYAEGGVRKLAMQFWPALDALIRQLGIERVVEVGLTTGLIERVGAEQPQLALYGLDRSAESLASAAARAASLGVRHIHFLQADLFQTAQWEPTLAAGGPGLIFSLHFHEFLAAGEAPLVAWLQAMQRLRPHWYVVALEQPRLAHAARDTLPEHQWLYAQSNVLIHHLIGNGKILTAEEWRALGEKAGCAETSERACEYLGYRAFVYKL